MKKAFTLIELLAVIIILAVVALIATPIILDVVEDARKSAYNSSAKMIISGAKNYYAESLLNEDKKLKTDGKTNLFDEITKNMQGEMPDNGQIYINEKGQVAVVLIYNKTCYVKDFKSSDLKESDDIESCKITYTDSILNGADPEVTEGMIPVVFTSNGIIEKADIKEPWYNYEQKNWANVVLVSDETREEYKNANPGTTIYAKDVRAYYVWIPRYRYEIFTDVSNLEETKSISGPEEYVNKAQIINIEFEDNTTEKSNGSAKGEWLTHPAFTFGDVELNGIWVGKYETTGTEENPTVLAYDSRYTETNSITSLREQNVSTQFATSQKINYGLEDKEASMLKNMEWGAVAYLTASIYGQGTTEVMINNSSKYNTGCAATIIPNVILGGYNAQTNHTEGHYAGCENEWYTTNGQKASTTGNMYGIYDMSGGTWENMMGVMEDSLNSGVPASGRNDKKNSGFTGNLTYPNDGDAPSVTNINGVTFPDGKYYDIYKYGTTYVDNEAYNRLLLGSATYELGEFTSQKDLNGSIRYQSGWNHDYAYSVYDGGPWIDRGGYWLYGSSAGIFAFTNGTGSEGGNVSFRSVLR